MTTGMENGGRSSRISPYHGDGSSFFPSQTSMEDEEQVRDENTEKREKSLYNPPWTEPYIIGIAGNSGSGKTSVSQKVILELNQPWTVLLSFDNFYNPLTKEQKDLAFKNEFDFDTPKSLDLDLLVSTVNKLKAGEKVDIPLYSFSIHDRTDKTSTIYGANVIIIEGIYALYDPRLVELMDMKIFVDTDLDVCLARRLTRDILYRGRDLAGALKQWEKFVKPNAVRHVYPTMSAADLVIPRGLDNVNAINLMIKHIQKQLALKSMTHIQNLKYLGLQELFHPKNYKNVRLLVSSNQTKVLNSMIFSNSTLRSDFIFYFDRMATLIVENAIELLTNYQPIDIYTDYGHLYQGLKQVDEVFAINIIRSGDCFMNSIKRSFPEVAIGKLLIQSDTLTGEPQLHTKSFPPCISGPNKKIFLFDAQIISGAAAIMAIQVLLDHEVASKNIILCCYLCTEVGLRRILKVFPDVKIVIGKLSGMDAESKWYEDANFRDTDWQFRTRFIDSFYFGT